jgi:DNA-binding response OmpR family regulator
MIILLVEDDVELARSLIDRFQGNDYAVLHVGDDA